MAELSVRTAIRTEDFDGAHQAMVAAARGAGYTLVEQPIVGKPGRAWRRPTRDQLYSLSGAGPQDGAYLRAFRLHCVWHPRLQISQVVELPESELDEARKTNERFLRNIEDVVCDATGASSRSTYEPLQ